MLAAHLNPDYDSASRKKDGIINSVNWIEKLCDGGSNKKLLDLGCGPGIYAEMLAAKGFQVTGIDFSKRSIDYAVESSQKKHLDITYHYQNYLNIDYREEFDVVMQRNQFYEESNNTLEQYLVITEEHCKCYNIWNQIYSQDFLEKEVTETGLTLVNFFDDVQGKEYTGLEETICGVFCK